MHFMRGNYSTALRILEQVRRRHEELDDARRVGFLYAGTPSLLVSLWTVNDRSTAQLMRRFYPALQRRASKARALQEAVLEVKAAFPHPYYWAPFILMGKS